MKHTPGAWKVRPKLSGVDYVVLAKKEIVAKVLLHEADAYLIAAAPEMLEMLERLEALLERDSNSGQNYDSYTLATGILADIHRLILKARGVSC